MGKKRDLKLVIVDDDDEEEKTEEDWCFLCKDGGDLLLCDFVECRKVYHARCLGIKIETLKPGEKWFCHRHVCFKCSVPPTYDCFLCPTAVCKTCISIVEFARIKNCRGLCDTCLVLDQNIEITAANDLSNEEKLFDQYLHIIMDKEGFSRADINAASDELSKVALDSTKMVIGENNEDFFTIDSDSDEDDDNDPIEEIRYCEAETSRVKMEPDPDIIDLVNYKRSKPTSKRQRVSNKDKSFPHEIVDCKTNARCGASVEEVHNESKDDSFGTKRKYSTASPKMETTLNTTKKPPLYKSEFNVQEKPCAYEEDAEKGIVDCKTNAKCGASVEDFQNGSKGDIFGAKTELNVEEKPCAYEEDAEKDVAAHNDTITECKRIVPVSDTNGVNAEKDVAAHNNTITECKQIVRVSNTNGVLHSSRESLDKVAIIIDNINLVYLRKDLIVKLMNGNSSEENVIGAFVKVKNGHRNSYQLLPVTGVRKINSEILLQVSCIPTEITIAMLSDEDISEGECMDLQKKIEEGLIARPIVSELEQKAKSLHVDITKHWIERELARLQKRIGFLNERGKRREYPLMLWADLCHRMGQHMDKRRLLETELEQQKLLQQLPRVIAEVIELF